MVSSGPGAGVRAFVAVKGPLSPEEREQAASDAVGHTRPKNRSECVSGPRPCPLVGCRYHLALDVGPEARYGCNGRSITIPKGLMADPAGVLESMPDTCALDVADRGPQTLAAVGEALGVTRERIRQIEAKLLEKLGRKRGLFPVLEDVEGRQRHGEDHTW